MKRIMVIGAGGAGKSTFSRRLGAALGREVIHLDRLHWKPGWVETPKDEWRETVAALVRADEWIIDGNYGSTLEVRLAACDTVIFLDLPRRICVWRVLKRIVTYKKGRPDMGEGCDEKLDLKFLKWVWDYPVLKRPKVLEAIARHAHGKKIIRLRTPKEVESFIEDVKRGRNCRTS